MSDTAKTRRRVLGMLLVAGLGMSGVSFAWKRRLSANERVLVGVWSTPLPGGKRTVCLRLTTDRRYSWLTAPAAAPEVGRWRLEGDRLLLAADSQRFSLSETVARAVRSLTGQSSWHPSVISIRSSDSFVMNRGADSLVWIRGEENPGPATPAK